MGRWFMSPAAQRQLGCRGNYSEPRAPLVGSPDEDLARSVQSVRLDGTGVFYLTLEAMGFPLAWVKVIRDMHAPTQVRYLVNGHGSQWVPQTKGLRQGCPLASFLFILGMEPLLARLEKEQERELAFLAGKRSTTIMGVAHVDDLAIYLRCSKDFAA